TGTASIANSQHGAREVLSSGGVIDATGNGIQPRLDVEVHAVEPEGRCLPTLGGLVPEGVVAGRALDVAGGVGEQPDAALRVLVEEQRVVGIVDLLDRHPVGAVDEA